MSKKYQKLAISIVLDAIGLIPLIDIVWAPVSAYIMSKMYKGKEGKVAAVISFIEEAVPFLDFIPTFTLMWIYSFIIKKEEVDTITEV